MFKKLFTTAGYWTFESTPTTSEVDEIVNNAKEYLNYRDHTGLWVNARGMKKFIESGIASEPGRYFVRTYKKNWRNVAFNIQKVS